MKLTPVINVEHRVHTDVSIDLLDACDSVMAILTASQLEQWTSKFNERAAAAIWINAGWTWGSVLQVFDIDDQLFTIVSDSCGTWMTEKFQEFCTDNKIAQQEVLDYLDCENVPVEDIALGEGDCPALLEFLHKIYN
jgi:hypothetical protein